MTSAPPTLLAARKLLQQHLGIPAVGLGITGDPAHRGGYHCGKDRVVTGDYSVTESSRDGKPTDAAMALDVGAFSITVKGKRHNLATFSAWLVAQCNANAPDTHDIREVIYCTDGVTVRRWDRLKRRATGDSSHRYHTHISWHRDSEARDKTAIFRRYLTSIGVLAAPASPAAKPSTGADDVSWTDDVITNPSWRSDAKTNPFVEARFALYDAWNQAHEANRKADLVLAAVATLSGKDMTDEAAIVKQVLAGLTPAAIAAAMPPTVARQVVDILTERMAK